MFGLLEYQVYLTGVDAPLCGDVKEPYKVSWPDEDGDDEWVPEKLCIESFEVKLKCATKVFGWYGAARTRVWSLVSALLSKNPLIVYDRNGEFGWCGVRLTGIENLSSATACVSGGAESVLTFDLKLKVNDPRGVVSVVTGQDGVITGLVKASDE